MVELEVEVGNKCLHAIVHGRVQGVYFRDHTRREAQRLGLGGWVRNLPDGTVETCFEGAPDEVDRMLLWLAAGSPMSEVTKIDSWEEAATNNFRTFVVRYS